MFGGGTLNAPLVNYYEHGTFLTLNHAHTALFGAFGELAIGLIYFCLRYIHAERPAFSEKLGLWAFWLYNGGLVLWILFNFFPIGWPQLEAVYEHGLAFARSSAFYNTTLLLAVDAAAWRCGVCRRRAIDGVGFHRQAAATLSAGDR